MKTSTLGVSLAVLAIAGAGAFVYLRQTPAPPARAPASSRVETAAASVGSSMPSRARTAAARPGAPFNAPAGALKENLAPLQQQATHGDNAAAYFLATRLLACRSNNPVLGLGDADHAMSPELKADCRDLTAEDLNAFKHWLEMAADRGDETAQLNYLDLVGDSFTTPESLRDPKETRDYHEHAIRYLDRAAQAGNAEALGELAGVYAEGRVAAQDYEKAYAYELAYQKAKGQASSALADQLATKLSDEEKQRATALALTLYPSSASH
jgi:TPR repeat protein